MSRKSATFPNYICMRFDKDEGSLLFVGSPDRLADELDADDGDLVATYAFHGPVQVFRQHPRLEDKKA